jgi:uncharacterized protein YhhL (DUF1145 family)
MRTSRWLWLATAGCAAVWLVLLVVVAPPTGWIHLPLVAAVLLAVRAIVAADAERAADRPRA